VTSNNEKENSNNPPSQPTAKSINTITTTTLQRDSSTLSKKVTIADDKPRVKSSMDKKQEPTIVQRELSNLSNQPSKG
jgi:hypothetical protein